MALLLFSVLVLLAGLEVVLRLVPLNPTPVAADRPRLFYDRAAERERPWTGTATNTLRIAVIGDSFTRGVGVQLDDRYAARLEAMLNLNAGLPPAEVRVYTRPGTSTFQQFDLLRAALADKPRIVILGICLNDTEDWANPEEVLAWRDEWLPRQTPAFESFCVRHSRLAAFVAARIRAARSPGRCVAFYRRLYEPDYKGLRRFRKSLEIFRDECAAAGAAFVPVVFPLFFFDFAPERYPLGFAHDRIRQMFMAAGVSGLDLLPVYRATDPVRLQAVPGIDGHPSEIAHRIAAEALVNHLLDQRLIDAGYRPRERPSEKTVHAIWQRTHQQFQADPAPEP
jgi:hypothetical protein